MKILSVFQNHVLIAAIIAWSIAQVVKLPVEFASTRVWNWSLLLRAGGMPSSHAALVTAAAHGIGLTEGFNSSSYALAIVLAMIVIYDATGIRRQAGRHAQIINEMIQDLVEGHPLHQEQLMEVLGHSPFQALVGMLLGLVVAQLVVG
ncbi:MAG TPA: divergent PAP2 family protein [Anaerolineales bacterium]|nr:divergent PAP2 family protein [Anaerolineales bacterium]